VSLPLRRSSRREAGRRREPQHRRIPALEVLEARRLLTGPIVSSVDPAANSHTAPLGTDVSATFDQQIDPDSVSDATFAVHSMHSGRLLQPANTFATSGPTVSLDPAADFKPGELVQATTTIGIQNLNGQGSPAPYVWQFRTQVPGGTGAFTDSGQSLDSSLSYAAALGDLDGDGDLDAFVGNVAADSPYRAPNTVWLNDGEGSFGDTGQSLGNSESRAIVLGDVDGDGDLDAFVADADRPDGAPNKLWLNDGLAHFSDSGHSLGDFTVAVALGDLDSDGDLDAFVANAGPGGHQVDRVWLNNGRGHFSDSGQSLGYSNSFAVALADVDGDGDLDAFVAKRDANIVWLNDGRGHFSDSGQTLDGLVSIGIALGDVDGDGDLDVFVANNGPDKVWLNQNRQADLAISKTDSQVVATPGAPLDYTITVTNHGPDDVTGAMVSDVFPTQLPDAAS